MLLREKNMSKLFMKDILYGCAVGDALGVPFEFKSRGSFLCRGMAGYGTHHQPKGTWSDDTSMTLCLADCIADGFSMEKLADSFLKWYGKSEYTANGDLFDIGNATAGALSAIRSGVPCLEAGGADEWSNGNGSLMRIAPLVCLTDKMPAEDRFAYCRNVSSVTHAHQISIASCFIYLEFLKSVLDGSSVEEAFETAVETKEKLPDFGVSQRAADRFTLLDRSLKGRKEDEISSGGFVIDTLTASLWCILTSGSYKDAVLKAVNLGDDTDTTGAVAGSIAGLVYGFDSIPREWIADLRNKELIDSIIQKYENSRQ